MLIEYFLKNPTSEIYPQQLEKRLNMSRKSMFDALQAAFDAGLLELKETGRTKQYKLKRDIPIVKQLKILFSIDFLIGFLEKFKGSGMEIYLFGSAARGEDTEKSDIDLLVLGDRPKNEVLGRLAEKEGLKPVYFSYLEYSSLARKDKPFYERVEKDKIRLI